MSAVLAYALTLEKGSFSTGIGEAREKVMGFMESAAKMAGITVIAEGLEAAFKKVFNITEGVMAAIEPVAARAASRPPARVHSLLPRVATWISLGAAIAAGSVLVVRSWSAPPSHGGARGTHATASEHAPAPNASNALSAAAPDLSAAPELAAALQAEEEAKPPPATIESVDFGGNTGSVFVVSTDSSETPVVWMPDDGEPDEDNEDRSESL